CSCGEQATHECSETGSLVCGAPLCNDCEHTIRENGCNSGGNLPEGLKGHCKKVDQVYKPWYMMESEKAIKEVIEEASDDNNQLDFKRQILSKTLYLTSEDLLNVYKHYTLKDINVNMFKYDVKEVIYRSYI